MQTKATFLALKKSLFWLKLSAKKGLYSNPLIPFNVAYNVQKNTMQTIVRIVVYKIVFCKQHRCPKSDVAQQSMHTLEIRVEQK